MLLSHKNGKHVEPHLYRRHWLGKHRLDQRFGPYWMSEARFGLVYILFQSVSDFFRFARWSWQGHLMDASHFLDNWAIRIHTAFHRVTMFSFERFEDLGIQNPKLHLINWTIFILCVTSYNFVACTLLHSCTFPALPSVSPAFPQRVEVNPSKRRHYKRKLFCRKSIYIISIILYTDSTVLQTQSLFLFPFLFDTFFRQDHFHRLIDKVPLISLIASRLGKSLTESVYGQTWLVSHSSWEHPEIHPPHFICRFGIL